MKELTGKVVALTGAASGIGRALAIELASSGADLALADIDACGLEQTIQHVTGWASIVTSYEVDVSDRRAVESFADDVMRDHGRVDILINNAGVGCVATVEQATYDDFDWVLGINLWGVIHGVKAFLPLLRERPEAHIVNIGSVNSYVPFPTNGPYNISKFGIDALSQTLMQELAGTHIAVSCVYPGGVRTHASRNARHTTADDHNRFESVARMNPQEAARRIVAGIERDRPQIFVGADARLLAFARRLAPMSTLRLIGLAAQRFQRSSTSKKRI